MSLAADDVDILHPLSLFCRQDGRVLPAFSTIEGEAMPEPYRSLLVHRGDMTSRLENFHGSPLDLRVLHCAEDPDAYWREVLLCKRSDHLPVEYGAIEIHLAAFEPALRELILAGREPLGGLLNRHQVRYRSEPRAFLRLAPETEMNALFYTEPNHELFGRSNTLLGEHGEILARIVEVLRPLSPA